jgi:SWI/SNF-related matrix-associated actin-dependent regulator of chromatin subfamily A containing DEAD/H box 1
MMTPFVLRRRKDQVLTDLPKKIQRIEWCEMTGLQRDIYTDAVARSRKTVLDVDPEAMGNGTGPSEAPTPTTDGTPAGTPAPSGKSKAKAAAKPKMTKAKTTSHKKLYLENSSNVLMDLRKAALHPMLFRRRFTDRLLEKISANLLKEPDFKKRGAVYEYVKEDLELMSDSELHLFCKTYKVGDRFLFFLKRLIDCVVAVPATVRSR